MELTKAKLLLVEDDPNLGFVIQDTLLLKGYEVILCKDGEIGKEMFHTVKFDLCLFDIMLPNKDGITLAREIRQLDNHIPILFLTAKSMMEDKLNGFRSGADDYIVKPFSIDELCYRIEVFLRRRKQSEIVVEGIKKIGQYHFDYKNLKLIHSSNERTLTQREAHILKLLCNHQDQVLKREDILLQVWGDDDYFMGRSLDVFISKLRKYLKEDSSIQIVNYHGIGFRLEER